MVWTIQKQTNNNRIYQCSLQPTISIVCVCVLVVNQKSTCTDRFLFSLLFFLFFYEYNLVNYYSIFFLNEARAIIIIMATNILLLWSTDTHTYTHTQFFIINHQKTVRNFFFSVSSDTLLLLLSSCSIRFIFWYIGVDSRRKKTVIINYSHCCWW